MRILCMAVITSLLLTTGAVVHARMIIWDGEYQSIVSGSNMKRTKATVLTRYDNRRLTGYSCRFELDGKEKTLQFDREQCSRVGSHIICTAGSTPEGKQFTGDMCWGDIYLSKPHPSEITGK